MGQFNNLAELPVVAFPRHGGKRMAFALPPGSSGRDANLVYKQQLNSYKHGATRFKPLFLNL